MAQGDSYKGTLETRDFSIFSFKVIKCENESIFKPLPFRNWERVTKVTKKRMGDAAFIAETVINHKYEIIAYDS